MFANTKVSDDNMSMKSWSIGWFLEQPLRKKNMFKKETLLKSI